MDDYPAIVRQMIRMNRRRNDWKWIRGNMAKHFIYFQVGDLLGIFIQSSCHRVVAGQLLARLLEMAMERERER